MVVLENSMWLGLSVAEKLSGTLTPKNFESLWHRTHNIVLTHLMFCLLRAPSFYFVYSALLHTRESDFSYFDFPVRGHFPQPSFLPSCEIRGGVFYPYFLNRTKLSNFLCSLRCPSPQQGSKSCHTAQGSAYTSPQIRQS